MTKIDYRDEYFEKLDKISKLKASGVISEQEFKTEKDRLDKIKSANEVVPKLSIFNMIAVVLLILIIWWLVSAIISDRPEPEENLSIHASLSVNGIVLRNIEEGFLSSCKVVLNDNYSLNAELIDFEDRTYAYSGFTNNESERFNIFSLKPTKIFINGCKENPDRYTLLQLQ